MDDQDASKTPLERTKDRPSTLGLRRFLRRRRDGLQEALLASVSTLERHVQTQIQELLSSREHLESLQDGLVKISSWTMTRSFEADRNAELLFRFADWIEKRQGRPKVMAMILATPLLRDPAFLEAITQSARHLQAFLLPDEERSQLWDADTLSAFKDRAGDRFLDLLVNLASLEATPPPPAASRQARLAYFKAAPIPEEFKVLAEMTQGIGLVQDSKSAGVINRVKRRLGLEDQSSQALTAYIPGANDPHLRFLVFSTTLFLQTYLLRNLVEALPTLAEELGQSLSPSSGAHKDDIIDL